jgi:hypothetical protein
MRAGMARVSPWFIQCGSPYDWLCAIGGLAYVLAVAFFRWRG